MKPLVTTQRILIWLCMCSAEENPSKWKKIAQISFAMVIFTLNFTHFCTYLDFSLGFEMSHLDLYMFGFMVAAVELGIVFIMIMAFISKDKINDIFNKLSVIYNIHKNEDGFRFLEEANKKSEWMWSIYFKYLFCSFVSTAMIAVTSFMFCWYKHGHFNVGHLYYPDEFFLPWNRTTPLGYFFEFCFAVSTTEAYLIVSGAVLLLFISVCQHHQAFPKMFRLSINNWNERKNRGNNEPFIRSLISFHTMIKEWFLESSDIYSPIIIVQLFLSTIFLVLAIFCLDLHMQSHNWEVELIVLAASIGISTLLLYCYFGMLASESYEDINDTVYNLNWHELPAGLQKYLILMIGNMQKPVYYHGFEVAMLNLETFTSILRVVVSYYMMLKTVTAH